MKKKFDSVHESIEVYSITLEQKLHMQIVRSHLDYIERAIAQVDTAIGTMVSKYESLIALHCTISGVDRNSALVQVAHVAVKATDDSCYPLKYEQNAKHRGKKRAIISIARMILTAIH